MGGLLLVFSILVFRVGIGLDRVTARYIIEDEDTLYLDNDTKFFLEHQSSHLSASLNLSTLAFSGLFNINGKTEDLSVSGNLELFSYHEPDTLHLNHTNLDLEIDYYPEPFGFKLNGLTTRYTEPNRYFQNQNGIGGSVFWQIDNLYDRFMIELESKINHVPDSLILSNVRIGPNINLYHSKGWLTATSYLYTRRVRYQDRMDSRWESDFGVDFTESLTDWFSLYQEGQYEVTKYDYDDEINYDRQVTMLGIGPELHLLNGMRLRIGPRLRTEKNHPLGSYHDFIEGALYFNLEVVFGRFNLFIENEYGEREYDLEFYVGNTNYKFNELSAMGDLSLFSNLEFQVFTSYGPEWHTMPQDNSTFFLLSTRLAYRF